MEFQRGSDANSKLDATHGGVVSELPRTHPRAILMSGPAERVGPAAIDR